jgi:hypothetical protein
MNLLICEVMIPHSPADLLTSVLVPKSASQVPKKRWTVISVCAKTGSRWRGRPRPLP